MVVKTEIKTSTTNQDVASDLAESARKDSHTKDSQDPKEAERIKTQNIQRAKNSTVISYQQIPKYVNEFLSLGIVNPEFGILLQGNSDSLADSIRGRILRELSQTLKTSDIEGELTLTQDRFVRRTMLGILLDSLIGVNSNSASQQRLELFNGQLGTVLSASPSYQLERGFLSFKGASSNSNETALYNLLNAPYKGGLSLWQIISSKADTQETFPEVQKLPLILSSVLEGSDSNIAWDIRKNLIGYQNVNPKFIKGLSSQEAWRCRNEILKSEVTELSWGNRLGRLLQSLNGIESAESIKFREACIDQADASPIDVYVSLQGVKTEKAIEFRQKIFARIYSSIDKFQSSRVLDAIKSDDSEEAWKIRDYYLLKAGTSSAEILAILGTIGKLNTDKANNFIEKTIKDKKIENIQILEALPGSELEVVWDAREAVFNDLKRIDRLKDRTYAQMLQELDPQERSNYIQQLKLQWRKNGLHHLEKMTEEEVIKQLLKIEREDLTSIHEGMEPSFRYFYEITISESGNEMGTFSSIWGEVIEKYKGRYADVLLLAKSLKGLTSIRAGKFLRQLADEKVPPHALLIASQGVFTPEANSIRASVMGIIRSYSDNSERKSLISNFLTSLWSEYHSIEDQFSSDKI